MLKFFFWFLLAANIILFSFQQVFYDMAPENAFNSNHAAPPHNEDQIRILSANAIERAIAQQKEDNENHALAKTCIEIGRFSKDELAHFEKQLSTLSLPQEIRRTSVFENSSYMVFIPPLGGQKAANAKVAELKKLGISQFYVIKDQPKLRWAISLGVFSTPEAASSYILELEEKGITNLQSTPRGAVTEKFMLQLDNLGNEQVYALETLLKELPGKIMLQCPSEENNSV